LSEPAQGFKRVTPGTIAEAILVVVVLQIGALVITHQNMPVYTSIVNSTGYSYAPFGTSTAGDAGNALVLVALAFVATLGLVWVVRKRMVLSFKVLVFASTAIAAFFLTLITADSFAFDYLPPQFELPVAFGAAFLAVIFVAYNIFFKAHPWLSTIILGFIGAEVGSFFAETLPEWTAIILAVAFAAYDIYAVFKGPLKALIGTAPGLALTGMSVKLGEFTLGLGDVVFYTMLPSLALFYATVTASLATLLAIDVGVIATLYLLSKKRLLPGLPIPMVLGVATALFFLI
jgi:presenilin-like A22 family membrane protease